MSACSNRYRSTGRPGAAEDGSAVDAWGDQTDVPVVYQANCFVVNKSGYEGTGVAFKLSPNGLTVKMLPFSSPFPGAPTMRCGWVR